MRATWLYFLGTKKNPTELFIYGLSLPTSCGKEYSLHEVNKGEIFAGKSLFEFRAVKNVVEDNYDESIDLNSFYENKDNKINHDIRVLQKKSFIQKKETGIPSNEIESPIDSLVNITTYYTDSINFLPMEKDGCICLAKKLEECTNQPFYGNYACRLGCLEIASVQPWAESKKPFSVEYDENTKGYYFIKDEEMNIDLHIVIKIYHSKAEKIYEQLAFIPKDCLRYDFSFCPDDEWAFKYSLYNSSGELIDEDSRDFIRDLNFSMLATGPSIPIEDDFSKRDPRLNSITRNHVNSSYMSLHVIQKEIAELDYTHRIFSELINGDKIAESRGRWFPKKQDRLGDVANYLEKYSWGAHEIIIVDPYADSEIVNLALRLSSPTITVIASSRARYKEDIDQNKLKIQKLKETIKNTRNLQNTTHYHFLNKNFHDRFILFKNKDGQEIYCLSNSINSILKNDDYLVIQLLGKVKLAALEHVEKLKAECNQSNLLGEITDESE